MNIVHIGDDTFCRIDYDQGKLSITGVIKPTHDGDCDGCGQIHDGIKIRKYSKGWNDEILAKFIQVWKEWHLNDMKPYTVEQKIQGWDQIAKVPIYKYHFIRTDDNHKLYQTLEAEAISATCEGRKLSLSDTEKRLLRSKRFHEIYGYEVPEAPEFCELWEYKDVECTTLGWVRPSEHPDGILGKEGYGSRHYFHTVPAEVLEFLSNLPTTKRNPAWI